MLSISRSYMTANQLTKLSYQLILFINTFLNLIVEYKEKVHICHTIKEVAN